MSRTVPAFLSLFTCRGIARQKFRRARQAVSYILRGGRAIVAARAAVRDSITINNRESV